MRGLRNKWAAIVAVAVGADSKVASEAEERPEEEHKVVGPQHTHPVRRNHQLKHAPSFSETKAPSFPHHQSEGFFGELRSKKCL